MTETPTARAGLLDDVRVRSAVFDGPIDLLLTLAQRQQVDLNHVQLGDLAWDYLQGLSSEEAFCSMPCARAAASSRCGGSCSGSKPSGKVP